MIARLDDGVIVYADAAFCDLFGLRPEAVLGHSRVDLGLITDEERRRLISEIPDDGRAGEHRGEVDTAYGRLLIESRQRLVTLAGEACWIVILRDVTPHQRAVAERALLTSVLENAPSGVVLYDRELRLLRLNAAAEQLTGLRQEDVGEPVVRLMPDIPPERLELLRGVIETGEPVIDAEVTGGLAGDRLFRSSFFPIRAEDGAVVGCGVMFQDVTERGRLERRRTAIIETSLDAIVTMDRAGRIVEWNPAAERTFGFSADEAVGRTVEELIVPPDLRAAHRHGLARFLRTGEGPVIGRRIELSARRAGGEVFPAELAIVQLADAAGDMVFTAHLRDVSEQVARERQLRDSEERRREILASMLHAEEAERSRIATELHDDTVQVMTAALFGLDRVALVARKEADEGMEAAVALARATLEEATDRTRRLMFELRPAILHEEGVQAAVAVLADQTARETGAVAQVEGRVGRYDPMVEELIYRTAQEALANVRKHAAPDRITVRFEERDGALVAMIADDGRGFDAGEVRRRRRSALHFGLDTMAERIDAAGGEFEIDSASGVGTTVRIAVPVSAPLTGPLP